MMKSFLKMKLLLIVLLSSVIGGTVTAQTMVKGVITNISTGKPLSFVSVYSANSKIISCSFPALMD